MKKIIIPFALTICIFFIADKTNAQTAIAVKSPVPGSRTAIKDTARSVIKTALKTTIPDPVAAVANQGTEVVRPVIITTLKLPAVFDQNGKSKQQ